jgi:hypothetical protein
MPMPQVTADFLDTLSRARSRSLTDILAHDEFETEPETTANPIHDSLVETQRFAEMIHFTPSEFDDIFQVVSDLAESEGRRGPKPKLSLKDSMVLYLMFLATKMPLKSLGAWLKVPEATLHQAMLRVRGPLFAGLKARWNIAQRSPTFAPRENPAAPPFLQKVGLIVDSVPIEVGRPRALSFEEAKAFWSAKHHIYATKYEVAVRAVPPHVAMFVHPGKPAAQHDFDLFKEHAQQYEPYLRSASGDYFDMLADAGYLGVAPHRFRRILPIKGPTQSADRRHNQQVASVRYLIEQFFGKLKTFFPVLAFRYRHVRFHLLFHFSLDTL